MEISSWGESMYGGWYVSYYENGTTAGEHFDTYEELKNFVESKGVQLDPIKRLDN